MPNLSQMWNCIIKIVDYFKGLFKRYRTHQIGGKKIREVSLLSQGSYGFVYVVMDIQSKKRYAMKKILCQTAQQKQAYFNQVSCMKQLSECRYIIKYEGSHQIQRQDYLESYILMELAEQTLLDKLLVHCNNKTHMEEKYIIQIIHQTSSALAYMHSKGIIHQDIKVQNILLGSDGCAKLCDFGSCTRQVVDTASIPKSLRYKYEEKYQKQTTLVYRPPEMIDIYMHLLIDYRVDIWMLGCVLYLLNYQKHPFQQQSKLSIINACVQYDKKISPKMIDLIRHMLTPNPKFRPTAQDIVDIVVNWEQGNFRLNKLAQIIKESEVQGEAQVIDWKSIE